MKLAYPAVFYPWEDGHGYTVEIPDLSGCVTEGSTLADAILMSVDAAAGWVLCELESGSHAPRASALHEIQPRQGGFVSMIALDMEAYAEKHGKKAVKRDITIPAWLNTFAEAHNIDFSQVLQEALISEMDEYCGVCRQRERNEK